MVKSPYCAFCSATPEGGMYHICYEVNDIGQVRQSLARKRVQGCLVMD